MTKKPVVLVTDGIHPIAEEVLAKSCDVRFLPKLDAAGLLEAVKGVDALMVRSASQVTQQVLEVAPHIKIVGRAGVGTDNIDTKFATRKGVIVVNSPDGNTEAAAEHTIAMIFALCRHIPQADKIVKEGGWRTNALTGVELFNKTLGVVGFGKIGQRVAKVFQALGMNIDVFDPYLSSQRAEALNVKSVDLDTLLLRADVITLHAPKTPETHHLLNSTAFEKMKNGVRIVNCARGGIIDEQALIEAINSGKVAACGLDVFEKEPLPADSPLLRLGEKLITTPHLGASTEEAQVNVAQDVAEQIRDFFETGVARHAVNLPAFKKDVIEPVKAYLPLAEWMGQFIRQVAQGGANSIEVIGGGALSKLDTSPVVLAAVKGVLGVSHEGVNYVNAPVIAEEAGLVINDSKTEKSGNYLNLLTLKLETNQQVYTISGTLISDNLYQITTINGYHTAITPAQFMLLSPHIDKPGMIAKVSAILGEYNINVSGMQVARKDSHTVGGESMMLFTLDDAIPEVALETINKIDGVLNGQFLSF